MTDIDPNLDWYLAISQKRGVTPRCPFAAAERCPRYFQSLSLLGQAGSTKIPEAEEDRLQRKWEKSDLWPITGEQCSSISGGGGRYTSFSNFCPEVLFDRFNLFASGLYEHHDEIDRNIAHQNLIQNNIDIGNWKWRYWSINPLHFTECSIYSPLIHSLPDPKQQEALTLKPTIWGMSIDLKLAWSRIQAWFSGRKGTGR